MFSNLKMIRRAGSAVSLAMVTLWCGLAGPASIHAQELTEPAGATLDGSQATRSGPAIRLPRASLQPAVPTRRLSVAEAVTMGLEQNLDLQVERLNPQLQDLSVLDARSVYAPTLHSHRAHWHKPQRNVCRRDRSRGVCLTHILIHT